MLASAQDITKGKGEKERRQGRKSNCRTLEHKSISHWLSHCTHFSLGIQIQPLPNNRAEAAEDVELTDIANWGCLYSENYLETSF